jgi:hypothetical protein
MRDVGLYQLDVTGPVCFYCSEGNALHFVMMEDPFCN